MKSNMFANLSACVFACGVIGSSLGMAQAVAMSDAERSVVQVVVAQADGSVKAFGTAFFVRDDGTLATVNHVYSDAVQFVAQVRGGDVEVRRIVRGSQAGILAHVDLLAQDALHDLALLRVQHYQSDQWDSVGQVRIVATSPLREVQNRTGLTFVGYFGEDAGIAR